MKARKSETLIINDWMKEEIQKLINERGCSFGEAHEIALIRQKRKWIDGVFPELLASCRAALDILSGGEEKTEAQVREQLRAAIAKATDK